MLKRERSRRSRLPSFAVCHVAAALRAKLLDFETIRSVTTVLLGDVVTVFTFRASQSDLRANVTSLLGHYFLLG